MSKMPMNQNLGTYVTHAMYMYKSTVITENAS